jgi:hypothetical protein
LAVLFAVAAGCSALCVFALAPLAAAALPSNRSKAQSRVTCTDTGATPSQATHIKAPAAADAKRT